VGHKDVGVTEIGGPQGWAGHKKIGWRATDYCAGNRKIGGTLGWAGHHEIGVL